MDNNNENVNVNNINERKDKYKKDDLNFEYNETRKKADFILGLKEEDKKKLVKCTSWAITACELSVAERNSRFLGTPLKGEVWCINFGSNVGSEIDDIRPCIIVSYKEFNDNSNLVTVIPITHSAYNYNTQFPIKDFLEYSESYTDGTAKAEQITTKSKSRLGRKIGKLNDKGMYLLNRALLTHLDMPELIKNLPIPDGESGIDFLPIPDIKK